MKNSKRKALKILLISIPLLLAVLILFLFGWVRQHKLKDYKQFFLANQEELTIFSDAFLEQDRIKFISRMRDLNGVNYFIDLNYEGKNTSREKRISFAVPYWDDLFWLTADISKIQGDAMMSPNKMLGQFLKENDITEEEFLKWRDFLAKYDFLSIGHVYGKEGQVAEIEKTSWCGFQHRKEMGVDIGYGTSYMDVLNTYWIYYDEDGVDHFPDR